MELRLDLKDDMNVEVLGRGNTRFFAKVDIERKRSKHREGVRNW